MDSSCHAEVPCPVPYPIWVNLAGGYASVPLVNLGDKARVTDSDTDQAVFSMFESVRVVPRVGGRFTTIRLVPYVCPHDGHAAPITSSEAGAPI